MNRYLPCRVNIVDNRISFYRNKYGYSQHYVADYLGVSVNTVSSWETLNASPSLYRAMDLASLFRVSVEELFWRVCYLERGEHCLDCEHFSDAGCTFDVYSEFLYGPWSISNEQLEF